MFVNINGVKSKIKSLTTAILAVDCDIIMLAETKGNPPYIKGYTWYNKQRQNANGGGIAIGLKNSLAKHATQLNNIEDQNQEIIWVELDFPGNTKNYVGCRTPGRRK
jgi:exonuclease III